MQDDETSAPAAPKRPPWNKGKLIGAKPPLRPKHVWSIRTKLQIADRKRDLAMFNLAIDSKLRGCDVVALKVEDIAPHGYAVERATVRQMNARPCARKRPACRCGSRSPNKPGKQSMTTSVPRTESPATFCSLRRADRATACRPVNMHVLLATGFAPSVSIPACSGPIRCAGPRLR
jgi:hypothetical protein